MKALAYFITPPAILYTAMRVEWFANILFGLFVAGSIFVIGYSIRHHFLSIR